MRVETERGSTVTVEHGVHDARVPVAGASWGSIWAGFFVALAVEFILSLLMVGVFASMVHPEGGSPSGQSFGFGIAAWIFVQTLIAYYCGGYVAGRMARPGAAGTINGAAVWGITTVTLVYLLVAAAGSTINGIVAVIRGAFSAAAATTAVPGGVAVAIATWVPIYFFFTLLLSLGTAIWGARSTPRSVS